MAGIRLSTLPVLRFGRSATEPSVAISENGQVRFNTLAKSFAGDFTKILVADFDEKTRVLKLLAVEDLPKSLKDKGWTEDDIAVMRQSKSKDGKVKGGMYISLAVVFRKLGYNFKASGNQTFTPTIDPAKHTLTFVVPEGALKAKPKQARFKKEKAPVAKAAAASASAASDDIVIE